MILITRTADPEWLDTIPTSPAPLDAAAPRIPRQREVNWPGLALLAAVAASAAGFGWLALLAFL